MADVANKYPQNVAGRFYVDDQCIDCDLCRETAPANFTRDDEGGLSWVEIKPASKGRNDPASGARIRPHEERGIFLSNKPDINELMRACLEGKCRLTQIFMAGSFRPLLAGL